jgi:hypothetical protein
MRQRRGCPVKGRDEHDVAGILQTCNEAVGLEI